MTALQRLLRHPHAAVFDTSPGAELALRVRHPDGARWEVADEWLKVTAGTVVRSYDLRPLSIGALAAALTADGFEVSALTDRWLTVSATVLVEGSGDQGTSNGDRLFAFTSLLWALLSGYAAEGNAAEYQVRQALLQMVLGTAEREWLDLWGALYGVSRWAGESDAAYAPRIAKDAFRVRVNGHGIEQAILDATGWDVRIEEPWTEIFTLDQSLLSGPDRLYDGERYGYHLIRPYTSESVDWPTVLAIIERNRAAGVLVTSGRSNRSLSWLDASGATISVSVLSEHARLTFYEDRTRLDYNAIEDIAVLNHPTRHRRELLHSAGSSTWNDAHWRVQSLFSRDFRVSYIDVQYRTPWLPRTWRTTASWSEAKGAVSFPHSRS